MLQVKERKLIMRTVTEKAIKAFLNGKNCKLGGKQYYTHTVNTEIKDGVMYLHENAIAKLINGELYVSFAGWGSVTTRERLEGFRYFGFDISVSQYKHEQYLNGKKVDDLYKWHHIEKI